MRSGSLTMFGRRRRAFTLVELLVVISIISVLIVILIVVARPPGRERGRQIIKELTSAIDAYYQLYGAYPPSNTTQDGRAKATGAQSLYFFLMGPNEKGWGPTSSGNEGNIPPAYAWKPIGVKPEFIGNTATGGKYFTDDPSGDRAVLYYRANTKWTNGVQLTRYGDIYAMGDNSGDTHFWVPDSQQWARMIANDPNRIGSNPPASSAPPFNPRSFLLICAGEDGEFGYRDAQGKPVSNISDGLCDDITNWARP